MNSLEQQAVQIIEKALYYYFVENNTEKIIKLFSKKRSSWIGWANEEYLDYKAVYDTFTARMDVLPKVDMSEFNGQVLFSENNIYVVYASCQLECYLDGGIYFHERARYTGVLGLEEDGLKIWHLNSSADWRDLEDGEFYPSKRALQRLQKEEKELSIAPLSEAIAFHAPNGLKCCKIEKDYPAIFINKALYTMAGYKSMVEMQTATNGKLSRLIYSADLEKVKKAMGCHTDGDAYVINYRLLRKNDSPIWVIERGQYFISPDGEEYYLCSIAPLYDDVIDDLCYGNLLDMAELENPHIPMELWFKTALEIISVESNKRKAMYKLLRLTANVLQLPGAFVSYLEELDEPVKIYCSYYGGTSTPPPDVLPYTPKLILPSFHISNISQASNTELMPKDYYDRLQTMKINAYYSVLLNINDENGTEEQYVLNFYQQNKPHQWTQNEKDLIIQMAKLCTVLLR